jgi:alpha-tubulin suppressor-like RCC1 family protein
VALGEVRDPGFASFAALYRPQRDIAVMKFLKGIAEVPAPAGAISEIILGDDSGIGTYICARLASETVQCMGGGRLGQLGNGKAMDSETWVNVQGVAGAKKLFNGNAYVFAQLADGNLLGWGFNNNLGGVAGIGKMLNNVSTPSEPVKLVNSK